MGGVGVVAASRWLSGSFCLPMLRDTGQIPGTRRSPGEGNGNLLQYFCLGNSMDRGAWQAIVPGVNKKESNMTE